MSIFFSGLFAGLGGLGGCDFAGEVWNGPYFREFEARNRGGGFQGGGCRFGIEVEPSMLSKGTATSRYKKKWVPSTRYAQLTMKLLIVCIFF